jgi:hypothetical protein
MDLAVFTDLVERLTGTSVKDLSDTDRAILGSILKDGSKALGYSQLNELMLLANKDRMNPPFFDYFFGDRCTVDSLADGVVKFQRYAMLCFGNFIYAYRKLSRAESNDELSKHLGEWARSPADCRAALDRRHAKLVEIEVIARDDTFLVGYLSAKQIIADKERAEVLLGWATTAKDWQALASLATAIPHPEERETMAAVIDSLRSGTPAYQDFLGELARTLGVLTQATEKLEKVRAIATKNQDIYLTWDHMDVYFATSMRAQSEYEDLFDFVRDLMQDNELLALAPHLRYFDPTQAFTKDRINKGLVEALMLKRARLTVYSIQDTDTLGKDSELAATLAQGKPVIAYVPRVQIRRREEELLKKSPFSLLERLRIVTHTDDRLQVSDRRILEELRGLLDDFCDRQPWRTIPSVAAVASFRDANKVLLSRACGILARGESRIYDRRADTLQKTHPLGLQVNLETGVANGVLVVRSPSDCARVMVGLLTNSLETKVEMRENMWRLRETISGCDFRVVSQDVKLTNCFWNFYRRG